jgi:hypothetical protein
MAPESGLIFQDALSVAHRLGKRRGADPNYSVLTTDLAKRSRAEDIAVVSDFLAQKLVVKNNVEK